MGIWYIGAESRFFFGMSVLVMKLFHGMKIFHGNGSLNRHNSHYWSPVNSHWWSSHKGAQSAPLELSCLDWNDQIIGLHFFVQSMI